MTYLLLSFLVVLLVPLFAATWRISLLGLSLQGLLLGWMTLRGTTAISAHAALAFADLVVVRGLVLPRYLYRVLKRNRVPPRSDVIAANFFSWTLAGVLVFGAFRFASSIAGTDGADATQTVTHIAVAASALGLGLFVLASRNTVLSQTVGLLRIENAIVLFELAAAPRLPLAIHFGITLVFFFTMLTLAVFFRRLAPPGLAERAEIAGEVAE